MGRDRLGCIDFVEWMWVVFSEVYFLQILFFTKTLDSPAFLLGEITSNITFDTPDVRGDDPKSLPVLCLELGQSSLKHLAAFQTFRSRISKRLWCIFQSDPPTLLGCNQQACDRLGDGD